MPISLSTKIKSSNFKEEACTSGDSPMWKLSVKNWKDQWCVDIANKLIWTSIHNRYRQQKMTIFIHLSTSTLKSIYSPSFS